MTDQERRSVTVETLRWIILRGGLRLPDFDHWRTSATSKPSDPDDIRWDCSCGYAGSPEAVERHWTAMLPHDATEPAGPLDVDAFLASFASRQELNPDWREGIEYARLCLPRLSPGAPREDERLRAEFWWATRWVAQYKSDGSGKAAASEMNERANELGRQYPDRISEPSR
jgi:hypothetical protein